MKLIDVKEKYPDSNGPYLCLISIPMGKECKKHYQFMVLNYNDKIGFRTNFNERARVEYWHPERLDPMPPPPKSHNSGYEKCKHANDFNKNRSMLSHYLISKWGKFYFETIDPEHIKTAKKAFYAGYRAGLKEQNDNNRNN